MEHKVRIEDDKKFMAAAIRLYKMGCKAILHRDVQESLVSLFCRGEEFAQAKRDLESTVSGLK